MTTTAATADTPDYCVADFSLVPPQIGSSTSSYAHELAGVHRLVRESGLKNQMHPTGTRIGKTA
ncbi:cell wall biogenesis protein [Penicillium diatomitis]|uniref:Cell wall biogenesis protein n=1 Tax=Penicillium diatomitis TaxID=2819901 RepID=A0A9W9XE16_9EURO|nr:cell wall biogenesis protein [Penicillium diatomitis]KAJ5489511.1 cell wall biogenesis protein [Penicillium diatomitis]